MTTITISLHESIKAFLENQAAALGYSSVSNYVESLISRERLRATLDAKLLVGVEALDRGEGREFTSEDWERMQGKERSIL